MGCSSSKAAQAPAQDLRGNMMRKRSIKTDID
eukprot:CAMPEP_0172638756 /NCGR_PEP_ID=MMETSP1068-20121228/215297_1 /TAXON_ID=35684 /ORGANISM="Pseudopedinella elastica, Strain CCMP716" /LENGTH=31 /DNA_ID= /DNA_START= /DNA_END= /DNA_ORIENTATION=